MSPPRYYIPDEITEDYIDHVCGSLECDIANVRDNDDPEYKLEMREDAIETLRHIEALLDVMMEK